MWVFCRQNRHGRRWHSPCCSGHQDSWRPEAMIRIKNVLVATDFSEPSAVALDYGREVARTYGAQLHVLHIVEDLRWRYATDMAPTALVGIQEDVESSARSRLNTLVTDE